MNCIHWYTRMLKEKPFTTKCITSFITFGLGDLICQSIESKYNKEIKAKPYDFKRAFKQASFGVFITPYLHIQFNIIMPKLFPKPGYLNLCKLLLYDQTINASIFIFCFFSYIDYFNNVNFRTSLSNTLLKFPPTLIANWKLWPAAQFINFTVVPAEYRVFFANIIGIVWNTYLSYVQNSKEII